MKSTKRVPGIFSMCSGPAPRLGYLKQYRAAQHKAIALLDTLSWPICMGLTDDALQQIKELEEAVQEMKNATRGKDA